MNKQWGVRLAAGMLVTTVIAGCSSKAPAEGTPAPETKKPTEPVELVFQSLAGGSEEAFNATYGDKIRSKFPDYTIKFIQSKSGSTLTELVAVQQRVDIVYNSIEYVMEPLLATGLTYDMSELIKKHNIDLNRFEPTIIEGIKAIGNGKMYMMPITNMRQVMFYNKGVFDKLGVAYPKDGMTWEETFELANKLTRVESGEQYLGLSASPAHILRTNQLSQPYVDPKTQQPTFTNEAWKTLLQTYFLTYGQQEPYVKRSLELKGLPYYTEMTNTQRLGMMIFNSAFPFDGAQYVKNIDWDLVSMPTFRDKPTIGSQASPGTFAITSIAKDKDAAMEVIKFLTSDEAQMAFSKSGMMTVLQSDEVKKVFGTESIHKGKNWPAVYYHAFAPLAYKSVYELGIERLYAPLMLEIVSGQTDLNSGLRKLQEQAEKYIAEQKAK